MRCLYDVLDLERDADDAQIKIAYRKGALRWHPDKNQDNLKEAEERFKELQNAYEVLSDKHERSWYDSHRTDILRGGAHQTGGGFTPGEAPPDDVNLYPYFSSTCFTGYSDGPSGFYGVYERLFSQLAKQEVDAERQAGKKGGQGSQEPASFGTSMTPWSQISDFYSYWLNFSTSKSFAWADKYNPASATNRKIRRLMEADNQKARKAKRREFNELVQELASFVRKRDKRVAAYQAEQAQKRIQKEAEEQARRDEERRERVQRACEFEAAAWAEIEPQAEARDSAADVVPEELYCVACDKSFRSRNALSNHEKSKKHLEKLEVLRQALEEEGELSADDVSTSSTDGASDDSAADEAELLNGTVVNSPDGIPTAFSDEASEEKEAVPSSDDDSEDDSGSAADAGEEDDMLEALLRMQPRKQAGKAWRSADSDALRAKPSSTVPDGEDSCTGGAARRAESSGEQDAIADATERLAAASLGSDRTGPSAASPWPPGEPSSSGQKPPKKKARRKGAGKQPVALPAAAKGKPGKRKQKDGDTQSPETALPICSVCGSCFASRTKLFQHIKDEGHAALRQ